jgi:serine/threonine-protein kinase
MHLKEVREDPIGRRVLARHRVTRRPFAITYLSPEFLVDAEFRVRFGGECARLARVREARIARVHRYVECDHGAAVIGDHIRGTPLRALLVAQGAIGTAAALVVLKEALRGLAACHEAGLAHGDLKPEHVILTSAGRVRLIDFGLWTSEGRRLLSRSTPFYLAPEQWSGSPGSQAGDVYAATVTFFECLAGAPPFYADGAAELSAKHAHGVPPVEVVPEPVRELVLRGLAKNPGSRPEAQRLLTFVGEVATRAVGSDWERQGRRELAALVANRSALPDRSVLRWQRGGAGRGYGKPVRLAAVMGGALAVAAGLSSPPLAVIPGISIFGPGVRPPVLAFPELDRGAVAVRVMTNGPLADRASVPTAKPGAAGTRPSAPPVPAPRIHTAPYEQPTSGGSGQDTARPDGAANQYAPGQAIPAPNPQQPAPDSTGSTSEKSPAPVPVSLPVELPVPVEVPVQLPVPVEVPARPPASIQPPVQVPKSIVIRDKAKPGKDIHSPRDSQAQLDSQRPRKTLRAQRPGFTGHSVEQPMNRSQRGYGHSTSAEKSGNW